MQKSSALVLFLLFPFTLFAQKNVEISVSASVGGAIEMFTIQTMDFEEIERNENIISVNPIESARAGKMIARGAPNTEFRIDFLREQELTNTIGAGTLVFNYSIAGNSVDEQETAELLDQEMRDLQFNEDGEFFIWVGGNTNISEAEPGRYEGEFTLEIEYI